MNCYVLNIYNKHTTVNTCEFSTIKFVLYGRKKIATSCCLCVYVSPEYESVDQCARVYFFAIEIALCVSLFVSFVLTFVFVIVFVHNYCNFLFVLVFI